jgi:ergothioneine biosynthesis protein EgtB
MSRASVISPAYIHSGTLAQCYLEVRHMTEHLCSSLCADDQMVQSMQDASPAKWHQAHTSWFFETFLLAPHLRDYKPLDSRYQFLFNSYYKQVENSGEQAHPLRAIRGTFSRPTLQEVSAYRQHVDAEMLRLLEDGLTDELASLVDLGINHEQQHQELILTDIKHAFWINPLRPAYTENKLTAFKSLPISAQRWVQHDGGLFSIGHNGHGFAFDNEGPRHQAFLQPFRMASRLVTNSEYLEFINDSGYSRPELWLSDGWDMVQAQRWVAPLYWEQRDGIWRMFTLHGMREVQPKEPVSHVSYYEADAYARWAGVRLPLESEWECVVADLPVQGHFLEDGHFCPMPAHAEDVPAQMFGDVWEWTSSPYAPYPGYHRTSGALGEYNAKFMCSQMVLRGGSCATPRSHIRTTYRNFFAPHARWQFSGIRLANDCN